MEIKNTYKCLDCHSIFDEPVFNVCKSAEYGDVTYAYCPECGSEDFDEAYQCRCCHEWRTFAEGCKPCTTKARAILHDFAMRFDDVTLQMLDDVMEGESFFSMREVDGID